MSTPDEKGDVPDEKTKVTETTETDVEPKEESTTAETSVPEETPSESSESIATPSETTTDSSTQTPHDTPVASTPTLDQARTFLEDDNVRSEPRDRKAAFLSSKGYSTVQIGDLLREEQSEVQPKPEPQQAQPEIETQQPETLPQPQQLEKSPPPSEVPPIVTYPEFLARPPRPPPLITPNVFFNTLYAGAAAASLIYGTARLVLAPMVDSLTEARTQLHDMTGSQLTRLVERLETVVSEVPEHVSSTKATTTGLHEHEHDDAVSTSTDTTTESFDDPTEVFHRDVGVQTSIPASPVLAAKETATPPSATAGESTIPNDAPQVSPSKLQADKLNGLVTSVHDLCEAWTGPSLVAAEAKTALDQFRQDLDKLARTPPYMYGIGAGGSGAGNGGKYPGYVLTTRNEPDDEIRKAKENIRRVKGVLLTTRTFPTAK